MKLTTPMLASILVAVSLLLSNFALADTDALTAAVQPGAVPTPAAAHAQRALAAHLKLWTAQDRAHYPYESILRDTVVYEFPYAESRSDRRIEGKAAIADHLRSMAQTATNWTFSEVKLFPTLDPSVFFVSLKARATVCETGRAYRQTYMLRITLDGDKISNLLVLWDQRARADAFASVKSNAVTR
jgi:uncharacterized protein